jgi:hypothetical protein
VPFTLTNLKEDLDFGSKFDGAPDLEIRLATEALELKRSGLSDQRVPSGFSDPFRSGSTTTTDLRPGG